MDGVEYLVGAAEIGELLAVDHNTINQWRLRHDDFPQPVRTLTAGNVWDARDVVGWAVATGRLEREDADVLLAQLRNANDAPAG